MAARHGDAHLLRTMTAVVEHSDRAIAVFAPSTRRIRYANQAFSDLTGIPHEQIPGQTMTFCLGRPAAGELSSGLKRLLLGPDDHLRVDLTVDIPLRPRRAVEATLHLFYRAEKRRLVGAYITDVSRHARHRAKAHAELAFLQSVVDQTLQPVIVTDMKGRITLFNRGAQKLLGFGVDEVVGRRFIQDLYEGNAAREVMERARGIGHGGRGCLDRYECILISATRERIPVWLTVHLLYDETGAETGTVTYAHDTRPTVEIARRLEEMQMQLIHADKMSSLGKLAAGVAHEINNPLGGILLFGGLLLEDMDFSDPRREDMDRIVQEARRCKEIVNSLLDYAHQRRRYQELVDLNAAVEQCLSLLGTKALFHNVTLERDLPEGLPLVVGNPSQIKQVFTNIVTNAVDAMEGEGTLRVESGVDPDTDEVWVEFSDTGPGMPSAVQARIFEPFFTTKEPGQGTGLGLSLSYNIMKIHHGDIRVGSSSAGGTRFTVVFPVPEEETCEP